MTNNMSADKPRFGIQCPDCGSQQSYIVDSRPAKFMKNRPARNLCEAANYIRRRRKCSSCSKMYSTTEVSAEYISALEHKSKVVESFQIRLYGLFGEIKFIDEAIMAGRESDCND